MNIIKQIFIVVFLVAVLGFFMFFKMWQSEKAERIREQNNVESLMISHKKQMDLTLNLTKDEFREFKSELISTIKDSLQIKTKQIERVTTNTYNYTYDTVRVELKPQNDSIFNFNHSFDNCMSIGGRVDILNKDIYFDDPVINYRSTSTYYWEKQKKFLFIKWKKQYFKKTFNNCTGETKIEKIIIK